MRASKLLKLPVMAMREGIEQGQVVDLVVDPEKKRVSHYIVRKGSRYDLLLVASTDIRGIGTGYLVVPDSSVVRRIFGDARRMEIVSRGFFLTDSQVISDAGIALGAIVDYDFDPRTSLVLTLVLENGAQYPASQIVGLSGNTVFVSGNPSKGASAPKRTAQQRPASVTVQPQTPASPVTAPVQMPTMRQQAPQQNEQESIVVAPVPSVSTPPSTGNFTRPAPSVSAQLRNAYKPEPMIPEKKEERDSVGDGQTVKPPNVLRRLLVGKRLADGVTSADGIFTLPAGTVITEWHMQLAEQHDAVQQLMKHVEPG